MNQVADHVLDNASHALLDLVNSTVKVIRECDVPPGGGSGSGRVVLAVLAAR